MCYATNDGADGSTNLKNLMNAATGGNYTTSSSGQNGGQGQGRLLQQLFGGQSPIRTSVPSAGATASSSSPTSGSSPASSFAIPTATRATSPAGLNIPG